jgi:hypothetical protein
VLLPAFTIADSLKRWKEKRGEERKRGKKEREREESTWPM